MAHDKIEFIKSTGYRLALIMDAKGPLFDLHVDGNDGVEYYLRERVYPQETTDLIQAILNKFAALWPGTEFEFRVDSLNRITAIR